MADWLPIFGWGAAISGLGALVVGVALGLDQFLKNASLGLAVCLFPLFGLGMARIMGGLSTLPGSDFLGYGVFLIVTDLVLAVLGLSGLQALFGLAWQYIVGCALFAFVLIFVFGNSDGGGGGGSGSWGGCGGVVAAGDSQYPFIWCLSTFS